MMPCLLEFYAIKDGIDSNLRSKNFSIVKFLLVILLAL